MCDFCNWDPQSDPARKGEFRNNKLVFESNVFGSLLQWSHILQTRAASLTSYVWCNRLSFTQLKYAFCNVCCIAAEHEAVIFPYPHWCCVERYWNLSVCYAFGKLITCLRTSAQTRTPATDYHHIFRFAIISNWYFDLNSVLCYSDISKVVAEITKTIQNSTVYWLMWNIVPEFQKHLFASNLMGMVHPVIFGIFIRVCLHLSEEQ